MRIALVVTLSVCAATASAQTDACDACREPPAPPAPPTDLNGPVIVVDPPAVTAPKPKRRHDFLFRGEVGAVYSHLLERNLGGARADFELGYDGRHVSFGSRLGFEFGGLSSGLAYERVSWGFGLDGKLGPVRLGIEPRIGVLSITRATNEDALEDLAGFTAGVQAEVIVALIGPTQPSARTHGGLDLVVRTGYDWVDHTNGRYDPLDGLVIKIGVGGRY